ncbi:MAG: 3-phosphoshikimate 1-carboxyvinyltransferase, partial [Clostridiales bacterium]|nr:3-phosphoshikimate 1-carboxyvinyltransferase [Clostridiales bacterium]
MIMRVSKSRVTGKVRIPGSKSHTIRALFIASLAEGKSEILKPLLSEDALSAVKVCRALGSEIDISEDKFTVQGLNGSPKMPEDIIHVGNSGTTINFGMMAASLADGYSIFTGDYQIRKRPVGPLIHAMNNIGAQVFAARENGCPPVVIKGRAKGGHTDLDGVSSQFLSSLLVSSPLLEKDTVVTLTRLNEVPYAEITLWWLNKQGIKYENHDFKTI